VAMAWVSVAVAAMAAGGLVRDAQEEEATREEAATATATAVANAAGRMVTVTAVGAVEAAGERAEEARVAVDVASEKATGVVGMKAAGEEAEVDAVVAPAEEKAGSRAARLDAVVAAAQVEARAAPTAVTQWRIGRGGKRRPDTAPRSAARRSKARSSACPTTSCCSLRSRTYTPRGARSLPNCSSHPKREASQNAAHQQQKQTPAQRRPSCGQRPWQASTYRTHTAASC
jgi:hypothetical protein